MSINGFFLYLTFEKKLFTGIANRINQHEIHCVKSARVGSYSGPYFPAFGLNTYSEYGHFSRSDNHFEQQNRMSSKFQVYSLLPFCCENPFTVIFKGLRSETKD